MSHTLNIIDLTVRLANREVLQGLGLSLARGELVALLGPNGSGKSTLLNSIGGLCRLSSGTIEVCGFNTVDQVTQARRNLGFMVKQEKLPNLLTGRQCLQIFAEARGLECVPGASLRESEELGFSPWLDELIETYSLGTRQKLSVLLALLGAPPLILLDEPLNGLDPASAMGLKAMLRDLSTEAGCCVLMATHDLPTVEQLHDHVVLLLDGRIVLDWDKQRIQQELKDRGSSLEQAVVDTLRNL